MQISPPLRFFQIFFVTYVSERKYHNAMDQIRIDFGRDDGVVGRGGKVGAGPSPAYVASSMARRRFSGPGPTTVNGLRPRMR